MSTINNITQIPAGVEAARAPSQTQGPTPVVSRVEAPKLDQALLSTSSTYREFQSELLRKLEGVGFTSEQSLKLAQIGNLSVRQFTRATVLGQLLMHDPGAFDGFVGTLKNVVNRGKNVQDGVRVFMDGVDRLFGSDSREVTEEVLKNRDPELNAVTKRNYAPHSRPGEIRGFERQLVDETDLRAMAAARPAAVNDTAAFAEYVRFFNNSMEEFPTRFHVDAYAQNELAKHGLPLDDYVKLAGEIPPLRILNLLAKAAAAGQAPEAILKTLLAAYENGEDLNSLLNAMERTYGAEKSFAETGGGVLKSPARPFSADFYGASSAVPRERGASPAKAPPDASSAGSITASNPSPRSVSAAPGATVEVSRGDNVFVEFLAMGTKDGVLPTERTAALVIPPRAEIPGQAFNTAFLPVGAYMVMFAGVDSANRLMNLWMKVIVRESENEEEPAPRYEDEGRKDGDASDRPPRKKPPEDFLKPDFSGAIPILVGPFLGEIVLPLDFLSRDPGELAVVSSEGVVVSREEYERGVFPHHAVTFRFLANHVVTGDPLRRNAPLTLAPSAAFEKFDALMTRFLKDPRAEVASFESGLKDFFLGLASSFPAGVKTFEVARELFLREAKAYAEGGNHDALYDAVSLEKNGALFVSACYAKGACALAAAGDVSGALGGFARAAFTDLGGSRKSGLGEYLKNLSGIRYAREKSESVRAAYASQAAYGFSDGVTSAGTEGIGEKFLKALALSGPAAKFRPSPQT